LDHNRGEFMNEGNVTKNQLNFIKKLRESSMEREEKFKEFMKEKGKEKVEDLTIKEASELIEKLKGIKNEKDNSKEIYATGKQISFIENLQRNEKAEEITSEYLRNKDKKTVNFLTMQEASELIDKLKNISGIDNKNSIRHITEKQLEYLKNLLNTDEKRKIAFKYLSLLNKKNIEDLTSKEASVLIDKLK